MFQGYEECNHMNQRSLVNKVIAHLSFGQSQAGCESVLGLLFKLSCLCFCSDSNLNLKYLYLLLLLFFLKKLMMIILCWFDMELKLNFFSYAMI